MGREEERGVEKCAYSFQLDVPILCGIGGGGRMPLNNIPFDEAVEDSICDQKVEF